MAESPRGPSLVSTSFSSFAKDSRIREALQLAKRTSREIEDWIDIRMKYDRFGQYRTQLGQLQLLLQTALKDVDTKIRAVKSDESGDIVYQKCSAVEHRVYWISRIWEFYRSKFDQRDAGQFRKTIAAADEIVWSCYAQSFLPGRPSKSAPLPFITPEYSPRAIVRDDRPRDFSRDFDATFLETFVHELPIPLLSLPTRCIDNPCWMILIAHEIGHQVQEDLLPNKKLVEAFEGEVVKSIELDRQDPPVLVNRWKPWSKEIFADLYSILMTGAWSLYGIAELEVCAPKEYRTDRVRYPSPRTRLALMEAAIRDLKIVQSDAIHSLLPSEGTVPDNDLRQAELLATKLLKARIDQGRSLKEITGWTSAPFESDGAVDIWEGQLRQGSVFVEERSLAAPRLVVASGLAAWVRLLKTSSSESDEAQSRLKEELPDRIVSCRVEDTREATEPMPSAKNEALGRELIDLFDKHLGL